MPSSSDPLALAMKRVRRIWMLPAAAAVVLVGLVAAYWMGSITAAQAELQQSIPASIPVSATVEKRSVSQEVVLSGTVVAGDRTLVSTAAGPGVDRLVVTSVPKLLGDQVYPGETLAVVSGRPLLVLPSSVPLYRDIRLGDAGPDVVALQEALGGLGYGVTVTGIFGSETIDILNSWYQAEGFQAPIEPLMNHDSEIASSDESFKASGSSVFFRWREFVQIPGDSGTVVAIASPGTVLESDMAVAEVSTEDDRIVARADVLQAESFSVGRKVTVRSGSTTFDTIVGELSGFRDADPETDEIPGKDVVLILSPDMTGVSAGQSVTLSAGTSVPESLAVPLIAVRQEAGTTFVEFQDGAEIKRINVTVSGQADGWAALEDNLDLAVGDSVLLP